MFRPNVTIYIYYHLDFSKHSILFVVDIVQQLGTLGA